MTAGGSGDAAGDRGGDERRSSTVSSSPPNSAASRRVTSGVRRSRRCVDHTWLAAAILARAPCSISSRRIAAARSPSVAVPTVQHNHMRPSFRTLLRPRCPHRRQTSQRPRQVSNGAFTVDTGEVARSCGPGARRRVISTVRVTDQSDPSSPHIRQLTGTVSKPAISGIVESWTGRFSRRCPRKSSAG